MPRRSDIPYMQADIAKLDPITQLVKTAIMKLCVANEHT